MSDTPERIWAWFFFKGKRTHEMKGGWNDVADKRETPYVREELHTALQARLAEVEAERDRQYDENVHRIAEEAKWQARAEAAETRARVARAGLDQIVREFSPTRNGHRAVVIASAALADMEGRRDEC
jgi:hypothetical protein